LNENLEKIISKHEIVEKGFLSKRVGSEDDQDFVLFVQVKNKKVLELSSEEIRKKHEEIKKIIHDNIGDVLNV